MNYLNINTKDFKTKFISLFLVFAITLTTFTGYFAKKNEVKAHAFVPLVIAGIELAPEIIAGATILASTVAIAYTDLIPDTEQVLECVKDTSVEAYNDLKNASISVSDGLYHFKEETINAVISAINKLSLKPYEVQTIGNFKCMKLDSIPSFQRPYENVDLYNVGNTLTINGVNIQAKTEKNDWQYKYKLLINNEEMSAFNKTITAEDNLTIKAYTTTLGPNITHLDASNAFFAPYVMGKETGFIMWARDKEIFRALGVVQLVNVEPCTTTVAPPKSDVDTEDLVGAGVVTIPKPKNIEDLKGSTGNAISKPITNTKTGEIVNADVLNKTGEDVNKNDDDDSFLKKIKNFFSLGGFGTIILLLVKIVLGIIMLLIALYGFILGLYNIQNISGLQDPSNFLNEYIVKSVNIIHNTTPNSTDLPACFKEFHKYAPNWNLSFIQIVNIIVTIYLVIKIVKIINGRISTDSDLYDVELKNEKQKYDTELRQEYDRTWDKFKAYKSHSPVKLRKFESNEDIQKETKILKDIMGGKK